MWLINMLSDMLHMWGVCRPLDINKTYSYTYSFIEDLHR